MFKLRAQWRWPTTIVQCWIKIHSLTFLWMKINLHIFTLINNRFFFCSLKALVESTSHENSRKGQKNQKIYINTWLVDFYHQLCGICVLGRTSKKIIDDLWSCSASHLPLCWPLVLQCQCLPELKTTGPPITRYFHNLWQLYVSLRAPLCVEHSFFFL